jgi:hypothetical protein
VLAPLQNLELWADTGSPGALRGLRGVTDATPVSAPQDPEKPH